MNVYASGFTKDMMHFFVLISFRYVSLFSPFNHKPKIYSFLLLLILEGSVVLNSVTFENKWQKWIIVIFHTAIKTTQSTEQTNENTHKKFLLRNSEGLNSNELSEIKMFFDFFILKKCFLVFVLVCIIITKTVQIYIKVLYWHLRWGERAFCLFTSVYFFIFC